MNHKHRPVLFFHSVDAQNLNAQSNNTKEILARWNMEDLPAAAFHFRAPDPRVASNPNVHLIKLPPSRLWKARALVAGLGSYSAVVYPILSAPFDDKIRRLRKILQRGGAVITTLEGTVVDEREEAAANKMLSEFVGHPVHGQSIASDFMKAQAATKSNADLIIAISPFLQRISKYLRPTSCTVNIPLGVDLEVFHHEGRVPHGTNKRVQVVCAGSFNPQKRPAIFLELALKHPNVDFTWYGDGKLRASLLEQARQEVLHNLFFPGPLQPPALAAVFRESDIFALPSVAEGVPKVTQEAAACGLPVVCMNYYEPISVEHNRNGFLAENDDAFFASIAQLVTDAEIRARMGATSAKMAQEWGWEILAPRWQATIRDAVFRARSGCDG